MILFILGVIFLLLAFGASALMKKAQKARDKAEKLVEEKQSENIRFNNALDSAKEVLENRENDVKVWNGVAIFFVVLFAGLLILSSFTITPARSVKVPVTMGSTGDPMHSGPHWKLPITKVVKIDTVEQVDNWNNGKNEDTDHGTISVKLADGSSADAYVSLTWQINGDAASEVYSRYRSDDPTELVYERLVSPKMKQSVQEVLGTYNPAKPTVETTTDVSFAPDFAKLSKEIEDNYRASVGERGDFIEIVDLNFSDLGLDKSTQKRINQYREEIQKTKTAEQSVETATQQAKANKILAESLKSQEGTSAYCFSLIEQGKLNPPVGFSCYPNAGNGNLILPGGATR